MGWTVRGRSPRSFLFLTIIRGLRIYCMSGIMRLEREAGHSDRLSAQVKCLDEVILTYVSLPSLYLPKHDLHTRTDYTSCLLSV